jgi:predicted naringenin-chalcone synthase
MTAIAPTVQPRLLAVGTAVPDNEVHGLFIRWAEAGLEDRREQLLFHRMAERSGIAQRWSVLTDPDDRNPRTDGGGFYGRLIMPSTAERMAVYAAAAPKLALAAIEDLSRHVSLEGITHLVVASCTGFTAPGLDQVLAARLDLPPTVERLFIGYMGCYAGITALRSARHIVRSDPAARVLVLCLELCTLHLQDKAPVESLLAMLQFGDGAAAALVAAEGDGPALTGSFSCTIPGTADLIRWTIGDSGFVMHLSGQVPGQIRTALSEEEQRTALLPFEPQAVDRWAVHAGGRSILDAVETGLGLDADALNDSRAVLHEYGNMSSATLLFVLARTLQSRLTGPSVAMAFGPGLAVEGLTLDPA